MWFIPPKSLIRLAPVLNKNILAELILLLIFSIFQFSIYSIYSTKSKFLFRACKPLWNGFCWFFVLPNIVVKSKWKSKFCLIWFDQLLLNRNKHHAIIPDFFVFTFMIFSNCLGVYLESFSVSTQLFCIQFSIWGLWFKLTTFGTRLNKNKSPLFFINNYFIIKKW